MNRFLILAATGLSLVPMQLKAAGPAQARLYCQSIKFQRGNDQNNLYSLEFTTLNSGINGELAPLQADADFSHGCWFNYNDGIFDEVIPGLMNLDVPVLGDANGNGFEDFFEVSQSGSGTSSGVYQFDDEGVVRGVSADWSRAAGSAFGTCVITLQGYGTFTHTFQILEYTGPLVYTPGASSVSGTLYLEQTGSPETTLDGLLSFAKSPDDPFNDLTLSAGTLTNAALQTLSFFDDDYFRDPTWPTNYYGYLEFSDGDPNTGEDDYWLWVLSIDDANDSDSDGIPDFSDEPVIALPRPPLLSLQFTATNLKLTIHGDVGRTHQIQEIDSLTSIDWQDTMSLTLTNDPQVIELPLPESGPKFWRVLAK
ncbi:MAG TPA: hypothetical protein VFW05_05595 [Verrucomicrobiae bacterium]|nr:hypothetical protein [Verrucomicrobiae bacterium]